MIEETFGEYAFEFEPSGAGATLGTLTVSKGGSEEYFAARIDLAGTQSRGKWANEAAEMYEDTYGDTKGLKRALNELYLYVQEQAQIAEGKKAEKEVEKSEASEAGVPDEDIDELIGTPGVLDRYVDSVAE